MKSIVTKKGEYGYHSNVSVDRISLAPGEAIRKQAEQIKELKELLKISICPNKRCVDGAIEVGDYIEHGIEQCQFCDNKEQALKK